MASEENTAPAAESGLNLLGLAPEIVEHIIKYAPKEDLQNIRLANKELDKHAVRELFKEVFLSPLEEHTKTYTSISEHERLRRLPRSAVIHTQPEINTDGFRGDREPEDMGEEYEDAIAALAKFPNIDSIEIGFTAQCVGDRETRWYEDVDETPSVRKEVFEWIFQAIKDRAADPANRTIRRLTIVNLQNCPMPEFTRSDLFRDVTSQLEELHLQIIQESNEAGPDHDYTRVELQTFPNYLVSDWLKPLSENLKALSIYSKNDNWGPFPGYFRPSGLSLPKLETLNLGYYTVAHDDDLSWLFGVPSLKALVLHNCMILARVRIERDNMDEWKVNTDGWDAIPEKGEEGDDSPQYAYSGKWSEFFGRIAEGLPNLVDFQFDGRSPSQHEGLQYGVKYRDINSGAVIFPQRYLVFDNHILPTHWPEARDSGEIYCWTEEPFPNFHEERREEDQIGLDELLETCRRRVTGGGGSSSG